MTVPLVSFVMTLPKKYLYWIKNEHVVNEIKLLMIWMILEEKFLFLCVVLILNKENAPELSLLVNIFMLKQEYNVLYKLNGHPLWIYTGYMTG